MDRPIENNRKRKKNLRRLLPWGSGLLVVALLIWGFRSMLRTQVTAADFRIVQVEEGSMENTITASGLIVPSFEQQVNAPIATEIARVHLPSGTRVQPGDLILELDQNYVRMDVESRQNRLAVRRNDIDLLKLEYDRDLKELEYDDGIKALEVASAETQLTDAKRLVEIGGATEENREQAELHLRTVQLEKKKLENELAYRRKSLAGRSRKLELEASIEEKEVRELSQKLQKTEVRAPAAGVITWVNEAIGKKVAEGDPLVKLANLESFRIEGTCSDRYADRVNVGMAVKVRVNDRDLQGTVSSILPAVENNTLAFIVALERADDAQLRPNMRVELFLVADRKEQALRVPNGPAITGAVRQPLFVVRGDRAVRVEVGIGLRNGDYVELTDGGLQPGDRVIISDMRNYEHLSSIDIK